MASSFKRFLSILGSIALLIAAVIVFTNFIRPEFEGTDGVKQLRTKRDAAAATFNLATAQVDAFANLAKQYEDSFQYKSELDRSLPSGDNIPEVLAQIQGLAAADKVALASVTFQHPPMQSSQSSFVSAYGVLRASLRAEGGYNDIKAFIRDIENNIRLMDVSSMNLSTSGRSNVYSLQLTINTYYE
ncbi:MAG: type 4a pilus biogenesis protein PilO [Patescibacteria group bacterium]|nr:type 4a pilus biogenesis protein PilO [Patescibacteria group bacterium]MCL5262076.1 type 4a pilus biogenesis protein PilO [Patescibacteria group bacterium]